MPTNYREDYSAFALQVGTSKKMTKEETELYGKMIEWLRNSERSIPETEYRKIAQEDLEFYAGRQDSEEVLQELMRQRRPAEVYNEVKPKVDMLVGLGDQMRYDFQVVPVGGEDEILAEVMNGVVKHFRNKMSLKAMEMQAFEQTVKGGRCLVQLYVDSENPFKPEMRVKLHRGNRFFLDPDFMEYDLSDCRYLFVDVWLTEDDIRQYFPKFSGEEVKAFGLAATSDYPQFWNEAREKYRLVEGWYRKTEEVFWFISPFTGEPDFVKKKEWKKFEESINTLNEQILDGADPLGDGRPGGTEEALIEMPAPTPGFKSFIYYAIFSGSGLLESGVNPYWHEMYPFVFFGAYRDDNKNNWFSAISMMKDPQRGLNTMRRQLMHLLQTSPKGILMHESGAILNIEEYEKRSADPTYHMELSRDGIGRVAFTNQPQISPIYGQLDGTFVQSMKDTSGVQDSLLGIQTSSREPGVTVKMRQETGLSVLFVLFQNFALARKTLTKQLIYNIKQFVDEPTVVRIEGPKGAELLQINTDANPQSPTFNDISLGEYDLYVEEGIESSTMRMAVGQWLTEFAMNNPGAIPPDVIMEYTNLPFSVKQQVKTHHEQAQQAQMQAQQAEMMVQAKELELKEREVEVKEEELEIKWAQVGVAREKAKTDGKAKAKVATKKD